MLIEHRSFASERRFGIEYEVDSAFSREQLSAFVVEMESTRTNSRSTHIETGHHLGWGESIDNDFWHVKYDSSCGTTGKKSTSHGWELSSYVCQGIEDLLWVSKMATHLTEKGVRVTPHCGLHIHAEVKDFTPMEMGILHSHWIALEQILIHSLPKHRKNNKHCKPVFKKFKEKLKYPIDDPEKLWYSVAPNNFYPHENPQKKIALNSVGYAQGLQNEFHKRRTLELRMPECILDEDYVKNWTVLYLHFIDTVKNRPFMDYSKICDNPVDEALYLLGLEEKSGKNFVLLDEHLHQLKCWFLNRVVNYATRKKIAESARKKLEFITRI